VVGEVDDDEAVFLPEAPGPGRQVQQAVEKLTARWKFSALSNLRVIKIPLLEKGDLGGFR
jgi:hypothetical protein